MKRIIAIFGIGFFATTPANADPILTQVSQVNSAREETLQLPELSLVSVKVRMIEARKVSANEAGVGDGLHDIERKLKKLEAFNKFSLLSESNQEIGINQIQELTLLEGQRLRLKPVSLSDSRACVWLRWQDTDGMEILDSRMHFSTADGVIAGMEADGADRSVLLAINVASLRGK